jgi:hypothetical protein
MLLSTLLNEQDVNLTTVDPKSQSDIDRMDPKDAERFNKATIAEVNGMKHKKVFESRRSIKASSTGLRKPT